MSKLDGAILIVDDDEDVLLTAELVLAHKFNKVITLRDPDKLVKVLEGQPIDVVFLDMNFKTGQTTGKEGLFFLRQTLKYDPNAHVVMQTAYGDIDTAVESMKIGALDFITKPWSKEKLLTTAVNIYRLRQSNREIQRLRNKNETLTSDLRVMFGEILGESEALRKLLEAVDKVAPTAANVLLLGENGTGKELLARRIHQLSDLNEGPFVKVDLGTIPETLAESLLFGHKKGSFTDAREDRTGFFEQADGSTLFLDEIGNLPMSLQGKILSAIQYGQIAVLGSQEMKHVKARLVCATNKPLYEMVEEGTFREDLLYRINTVELQAPPLRERHGDVRLLVSHFLEKYSNKYNKKELKVPPYTMKKLEEYDWPGNVRELQHATERAVIMAPESSLTPEDFMLKKSKIEKGKMRQSLKIDDVEKLTVEAAVEKSKGNLTQAAMHLGMGRSTLYRKMKKYGLL